VDGDSNQMDPSNAFGGERKEDGPEDATLYLESQSIQAAESLLDLFSSQFAHFKSRLTWHYRSKHESLIATSNAAFYDGALTTFPAAANKPGELGLVYHHLPHTVYIPGGAEPEALENAPRRGLKAVNPLEAEAIVRAAMHHASTRPWESLAVVAFSLSQQQMIYRQLERFQPQMSAQQQQFLFPDEDAHERFVVKNLENVQGDERDVIYISVGYGRTARGKLTGNFGTLNRADGWRSLNVLITRAKKRCEVFVNFEPEEIPNLDDKKPDKSDDQDRRLGLKTFRDFLVRARAMSQPQASQATSSGTEATELSSQVASTLETWGYRVAQQVGSSQDRIDLAVYHPERRDEFILGIVCDGPHYARSRWTRDRDRIRPQVLGAMGWQLYALWSTDWYRDPHGERDRLLEHLGRIVRGEFEAALQDVEPSTDLTDWTEVPESEAWVDFDPDPASVDPIDWEVAPPTFRGAALFPAYQTSPLQVEVLELHSVAPSKIAGWLVDIVEFEGPLHRDQLARRLLQAAGVRKLGTRIQSAFEQGLNHALFHLPEGQGLRQEGEFIFGRTLPTVRDRSALPQNEKQFEYISDPELDGALKVLTEQAIGIEVEELATGCARAFGFERTTQDVRVRIEQRVDVLLTQGVFTLENDFLSLKPVAVL